MSVAKEIRVHGRVQGVFFRDSCRQEASRLGVAGWVTNEPDGTVAGFLEGEAEAVEALLDWCRSGPRQAKVEKVDVTDAEPRGLSGFDAH